MIALGSGPLTGGSDMGMLLGMIVVKGKGMGFLLEGTVGLL
jgi:hypothetical protein